MGKPQTKRIPRSNWKLVLKDVVTFLNDTNIDPEQRQSLWAVLTALRGPDVYAVGPKLATTCLIRGAIGLNWNISIPADVEHADFDLWVNDRVQAPIGHFTEHAQKAFTALGLKWMANNGFVNVKVKDGT